MSKVKAPANSKALAGFVAKLADSKIAKNISILDLSMIESAPSDFFVICSCESETQMRAISDAVDIECRKVGIKKPKVEGLGTSHWVILDFFDVVAHLMFKQSREFYNLEKLWADAQFFELSDAGRLKKKA